MEIKIIIYSLAFLGLITPISGISIIEDLPPVKGNTTSMHYKHFEVEQKQTFTLSFSPQATVVGKLDSSCHIHPSEIIIKNIYSVNHSPITPLRVLYIREANVLYTLTQLSIIKQPIPQSKHPSSQLKFVQNCTKDMAFDYSQSKIFIFTCQSVYQISTNDTTFKISKIISLEESLDVVSVRRSNELFVLLTQFHGTYIFSLDVSLNLRLVSNIGGKGSQNYSFVDSYYNQNKLLLLDSSKGLIYFEKNQEVFVYKDELGLKIDQEIQYTSFCIWHNSIFIAVSAQTQSFVIEVQNQQDNYHLVRYYKGYQQIQRLQIVQDKLLILSESKIDVFYINRDPRAINTLSNGYTFQHDEYLHGLSYINEDKFLMIRPSSLSISKWTLKNKTIQCQFSSASSYSISFSQPCLESKDSKFNQICTIIQHNTIVVYHRDNYLWLLMIFMGFFISLVIYLIYWRETKMSQIMHIIKRISKIKANQKTKQIYELQEQHGDIIIRSTGNSVHLQQNNTKQQQQQESDPYGQYLQSQRNNLQPYNPSETKQMQN